MERRREDLEEVRALAREFAESELRPNAARWDREGAVDDTVWRQLAEMGFFGTLVPEEYGGLGFDLETHTVVVEALASGEPAVALPLALHAAYGARLLLEHGTDEQRERWLPALASGDVVACIAIHDAGSDYGTHAVTTRAEPEGGGWVLNGIKAWVTGGARAGLAVVAARTGESAPNGDGAGKTALFLVPTDTPGFDVVDRKSTMGFRAVDFATLRLTDVRVSGDALLGDPESLPSVRAAAEDVARVGVAAVATGIACTALEYALEYAAQREQFGRRLKEFEGMQLKLAEMDARVAAGRALVAEAATSPTRRSVALAKIVATEAAMWVTTQAVQVYGGYGYMRHYPVERLMRDARALELCEGPNESLRVLVARELYGKES